MNPKPGRMFVIGPAGQRVSVRTNARIKDGWRKATPADVAEKVRIARDQGGK